MDLRVALGVIDEFVNSEGNAQAIQASGVIRAEVERLESEAKAAREEAFRLQQCIRRILERVKKPGPNTIEEVKKEAEDALGEGLGTFIQDTYKD